MVLNGQQIKRNDTPKFLGVKFDWNMTFTSHVKQVKDKNGTKTTSTESS